MYNLCNFVQFGLATMSIFVLQLWVILFYNKQHGADRAVTGRAKRRDRATESRKPNGMGAADERLQGVGRGDCESGIDL